VNANGQILARRVAEYDCDEPARRRQELPWVRADKEYRFEDFKEAGRRRQCPRLFDGLKLAWLLERRRPSDGYAAYDHVGGPKMVHAACWAHARRKFFQAVELNPQDQRAIRIVAQTDKLFDLDQKAREQ
jgi:hypothetical protein